MRDAIAVLLAVALPWLAGTLFVLALRRRQPDPAWLLCAGYGWLLGALATTLVMRAHSLAGMPWTLLSVAAPLLALTLLLAVPVRRRLTPSALRADAAAAWRSVGALPAAGRALFAGCLALVAVRAAGLALEIFWRPLLPFDAWSQWATKARVWLELGWMAPFVQQGAWLTPGDPLRFTDMHPAYPPLVPLLQVWTDLWLGRWDESLMNAPWIALFVALGFGFYAQLRRTGAGAPRAMLFTYLLLSLPFLDLHVALAGIADIFVAAAYGLAAIALWQWARTRRRFDLVLTVLLALVCASIKVEGLLWALTLLPAVVVALHRRAGFALVAAVVLACLGWIAFGPARIALFGYVLETNVTNVTLPVLQHLFVMDNWHLLWFGAVVVVVVRWRRLLAADLAPMTVTLAAGLSLIFVVFFMTSAAGGVDDESLVNRLPLHMVPALMFYLALLLAGPESARNREAPA